LKSAHGIRSWRAGLCAVATIAAVVSTAAISPAADEGARVLSGRVGEYQPVRGEGFLAWEQNSRRAPDRYDVYARRDGRRRFKVNATGTEAANGAIYRSTLVYQQYRGTKSDIFFYNLTTKRRHRASSRINTRKWEYWPSLSRKWLLFGRLRRDGSRRIVLHNRQSGRSRTLAKSERRSAFLEPGQVNGGWAVWSRCDAAGECNIWLYDIERSRKTMVPNPGASQRAPSVSPEGTVYFVRSGRRCRSSTKVMRRARAGKTKLLARIPSGRTVNDTYAFAATLGLSKVFYDHQACGRALSSDVSRLRDPRFFLLHVDASGTGRGVVTSKPVGVRCPVDCDHSYVWGTVVRLSAVPFADSTFEGWTGGVCAGTDPSCATILSQGREVTATFVADEAPPTKPRIIGLKDAFQSRTSFSMVWVSEDTGTGISSYDVRYRVARYNSGFGSFVRWKTSTASSRGTFDGRAGRTYCFSARARDDAGNISDWGSERCTSLRVDDRSLAGDEWRRRRDRCCYLNTYSVSSRRGATLIRRGAKTRRIDVLATQCSGCGTFRVLWDGHVLETIRLQAKRTRHQRVFNVATFARVRSGSVKVRVTSSAAQVRIDGLGLSRK
jgi:Divergent InlB B-repeat domain